MPMGYDTDDDDEFLDAAWEEIRKAGGLKGTPLPKYRYDENGDPLLPEENDEEDPDAPKVESGEEPEAGN